MAKLSLSRMLTKFLKSCLAVLVLQRIIMLTSALSLIDKTHFGSSSGFQNLDMVNCSLTVKTSSEMVLDKLDL